MSDIRFRCPKCGQNLEAPQDMEGQSIECPTCTFTLTIPGQDESDIQPKQPQRHADRHNEVPSLESSPASGSRVTESKKRALTLVASTLAVITSGFLCYGLYYLAAKTQELSVAQHEWKRQIDSMLSDQKKETDQLQNQLNEIREALSAASGLNARLVATLNEIRSANQNQIQRIREDYESKISALMRQQEQYFREYAKREEQREKARSAEMQQLRALAEGDLQLKREALEQQRAIEAARLQAEAARLRMEAEMKNNQQILDMIKSLNERNRFYNVRIW